MQYTSKLAILAAAFFSTSALAAPYASFDSELKVREADNELSAREYFDAYLEARENPYLDARDLEALDLEAREYLEYLEMREVAASTTTSDHSVAKSTTHSGSSDSQTPPQTPPQSPMSATSPTGDEQYPLFTSIKQYRASLSKAANFEDPNSYNQALANDESPYHKLAVQKYLGDPSNLKKALATKKSPYHKAAKRMDYLEKPKHYNHALKSKSDKYHKAAVEMYLLSKPAAFEEALNDKKGRFRKEAIHIYLSDPVVRQKAIANTSSPFHKAALNFGQKKHRKHGKKHSSSPTSTSTTSTATPTATHAA